MSGHTTLNQHPKKNKPSDCIICALRPGFYLSSLTVFQAKWFCHHSNPPSRPHFEPSKLFKAISITCNLLLILAIYNDFNHISGKFTPKHVLLYLEIVFNISTIMVNLTFLLKSDLKFLQTHGLIELINNKFKFGVYTILTSNAATFLHKLSSCLTVGFICGEVLIFNVALALENADQEMLVRMVLFEIVVFSCISFGIFGIQVLVLYHQLLDKCYCEIETFLTRLRATEEISGRIFTNRLQKLQRLYMCLRDNFKINEKLFQPSVIIIYCVFICFLLIGYGYFATTIILGEVGMLKFDMYVLARSLGIAGGFYGLCYGSQKISTMVNLN